MFFLKKENHEKAFSDIKNYYNDITLNNLAMIATLKEENRALAAKVTKIASLKRARTMQHDRRSRFRNMENDQENTESPAAKKRDTRNSSSSTTVDNK